LQFCSIFEFQQPKKLFQSIHQHWPEDETAIAVVVAVI
jgi:hypothetical protein